MVIKCHICGLELKNDLDLAKHLQEYGIPKKYKKPLKHPLKPWKDPESLFCDTEFLKRFIGKNPAKSTDCKS